MARFNLPPLTRVLLILLLGLTSLNSILQPVPTALAFFTRTGHGSPLLSLVPGQSFKYPWTLVTATFVEQNILGLIGTGLTLFFGGRYLERAWGLYEFGRFIFLISIIPNTLCFTTYIFLYEASKSNRALTTTVSGGIAIQSALLVAFKQLVPEHTVSLARILRIRVKHLPATFLLVNTIAGLALGTDTAMFLSWLSFFTSWTYLRYYQSSLSLSSATGGDLPVDRGDASDTFALAYFFPEPLHTPVAKICETVFDLLVALRVCSPFSAEHVDAGNEQAMARTEGGALPTRGGRRDEAGRRRALALQALDQRLHSGGRSAPAPVVLTVPAPVAQAESSNGGQDGKDAKAMEAEEKGALR
ncbi:DUF1751-domain-containing protein [Microthyrium microscopicum]|uniref:DUF1751-domain-containing protein n=1 Tax=Microthyrium microscopicum TaxID=703497 RepID=A0A6A6UBC0_9PEZI|nr:DUF1751-domain-containing protein [Microthyrium microscopicum]